MKEFFKVKTIEEVLEYRTQFAPMETEEVPITDSMGRILAEDIHSDIDLPDFARSIMDGFAVRGASTFGASEGNPAYLAVKGTVAMGESSNLSVGPGEAVRISTMTTLSVPAGSIPPVEIRTASPGPTDKLDDSPMATVPLTAR